MKLGYFLKLAWTNIGKNKRLYIPQMIIGICLEAVMYILFTIKMDEQLLEIRGGNYLFSFMTIGIWLMGLVSLILMSYTNSFLMKQRKREYGLYNVLGMGKKHISIIMLLENLISAMVIFAGGFLTGIVLYKLCVLCICKIMSTEPVLGIMPVNFHSILDTFFFFSVIFLLNSVYNLLQMFFLKPVELLQSVHVGEKEPKSKWIIALFGILTLGIGYYLALSVETPLAAINTFFVAVFLVIAGTYFLFVAGTIVILKLFKKNRKTYYHPSRMTAISGLLYRMKQNAVGLASICILSTCVLVMVSTTVSLYAGIEDMLDIQIPEDLVISGSYEVEEDGVKKQKEVFDSINVTVQDMCEEIGIDIKKQEQRTYLPVAFYYLDGKLTAEISAVKEKQMDFTHIFECQCITLSEYNRLSGDNLELADSEIGVFQSGDNAVKLPETLGIFGRSYHAKPLEDFSVDTAMYASVNVIGIVFPTEEDFEYVYNEQSKAYGEGGSQICYEIGYDFSRNTSEDKKCKLAEVGEKRTFEIMEQQMEQDVNATGALDYSWNDRYTLREDTYAFNGSLLFLGSLLGTVFIFATVLIIYYKQISEGYEDRERFQIMLKVGMSHGEVKKTIQNQILTVFGLPLIVAGIHVLVAFRILKKLLLLLFLPNDVLFFGCLVVTFVVFCIVYTVIYSLTARTYYKIVSQ